MNIIVCFSWLGNNSLSEKQVPFLLQLHVLGLVFWKVRHRTLRRAVTGAFLLLLQCLLRSVFLDVLCTGDRDKENTGQWAGRHVLHDPNAGKSQGSPRSPNMGGCEGVTKITPVVRKTKGRLWSLWILPHEAERQSRTGTCRGINTLYHHLELPGPSPSRCKNTYQVGEHPQMDVHKVANHPWALVYLTLI